MRYTRRLRRAAVLVLALAMTLAGPPIVADAAASGSLVLNFDPSNPTALQGAIVQAYDGGYRDLTIPSGTYRVGPAESGNPNLQLVGMSHLVIHADGVTLQFIDRVTNQGIDFRDCADVTLSGATVEDADMAFTQGTITAIAPDKTSIDVAIDVGYPTNLTDTSIYRSGTTTVEVFDSQRRRPKPDTPDLYPTSITQLSSNSFRLNLPALFRGTLGAVAVGDPLGIRGLRNKLIAVESSTYMHLDHLTLHNGAGFGINDQLGGHNTYSYISITPGPRPAGATADPLFSTGHDGLHSDGTRAGPTIDHLYIANTGDDGIAVRGSYYSVLSASGETITVARPAANAWYGQFQPSDTVEGVAADGNQTGTARVTAVASAQTDCPTGNVCYAVTADHELGLTTGDKLGDLNNDGQGFSITNSTILDNRGRGVIVKAGGTIEGNTIIGSSYSGIYVGPELHSAGESEGGYVRNLLIKSNYVADTGYNLWLAGQKIQTAAITVHAADVYLPTPGSPSPGADDVFGNSDITIEQNVVYAADQINLKLDAVRDAIVDHNQFVRPFLQQNAAGSTEDLNSVVLTDRADQATFTKNVVIQPGPAMAALLYETSRTQTLNGLPDGISVVDSPLDKPSA